VDVINGCPLKSLLKAVTRIFSEVSLTLSLSAVGAKIEEPSLPRGWGMGRRCPRLQKIFAFFISKW